MQSVQLTFLSVVEIFLRQKKSLVINFKKFYKFLEILFNCCLKNFLAKRASLWALPYGKTPKKTKPQILFNIYSTFFIPFVYSPSNLISIRCFFGILNAISRIIDENWLSLLENSKRLLIWVVRLKKLDRQSREKTVMLWKIVNYLKKFIIIFK